MLRPIDPKAACACMHLVRSLTCSSTLLAQLAHAQAKPSSCLPELCCLRTSSLSVSHVRHQSRTCRQQTPGVFSCVRQPCKTWHVASKTWRMHTSATFFENEQIVSVTYLVLTRCIPPPSCPHVPQLYACSRSTGKFAECVLRPRSRKTARVCTLLLCPRTSSEHAAQGAMLETHRSSHMLEPD